MAVRKTRSRHVALGLAVITCSVIIGWNVGGAWLWRSLVPAFRPVPLRVVFSNDAGGPVTLKSIRVGAQHYALNFVLPERATHGNFFFDFPQQGYVAEIEVEYTWGVMKDVEPISFKSDARRDGECELGVVFGTVAGASGCGPLMDADSVPWEPDLNGPATKAPAQ
jgi:hypothetical protein